MTDENWRRMCSRGRPPQSSSSSSSGSAIYALDSFTLYSTGLTKAPPKQYTTRAKTAAAPVARDVRPVEKNLQYRIGYAQLDTIEYEPPTLSSSAYDPDRPGLAACRQTAMENSDSDAGDDFFDAPLHSALTASKPLQIRPASPPPIPKTVAGWFARLNSPNSSNSTAAGRYVAVDCEMVEVDGGRSALGRVSLVNYNGCILLDSYCRPPDRITDYRTRYSGITFAKIRNAPSLNQVLEAVAEFVSPSTILIGHALQNDQKVLLLDHPKANMRDTYSRIACLRDVLPNPVPAPSLKTMARFHLGLTIQVGAHDSVVDASVAMLLYRLHRKEWEREIARSNHSHSSRQKEMANTNGLGTM